MHELPFSGTPDSHLMQNRLPTIPCLTLLLALLLAPGSEAACLSSAWSPQEQKGQTGTAPEAQSPDSSAPESSDDKLDLSEQVIRDVFAPLQRGFEGHNLYQVSAVFDTQEMPDYSHFRDRLRAFFADYDSLRFRYQLLQVTSNKNRAFAVADIAMEATPHDPSQVTVRRDSQVRFQMKLTPKGWKLVGFAPADFLTP